MQGKWVAAGNCTAPWITGSFEVSSARSADIRICGLGFFELFINGQRVTDEVLNPVWSQYTSRTGGRLLYPINDEMGCRVYMRVYDVTPFLRSGENHIAVLLGNGWFSQNMRNVEGDLWYGDRPQLWFHLCWQDESGRQHDYTSDEHLRWHASHIVMNNIYFGETQDLRVHDAEDKPVDIVPAPEGEMEEQRCPGDRIIRSIQPRLIAQKDGVSLYDAGENITGWVRLRLCGQAGEETIIQYAEEITPDYTLDFTSAGFDTQKQTDRYIHSGELQSVAPHFTWHGFRYFEIRGPHQDPMVEVVHSDVKVTGSFRCSDETINWLMDSYLRSRLGNMHGGVPSDCPHRERLGYTGDGQACADTDMRLLDADAFYRKWIRDVQDSQCRRSGHVQHTAPFYGGGGGPGGWGGAIVLVPWAHYQRYGDAALLRESYPFMLKWVGYMVSRMDERGLVVREEPKGWCLGDWCAPEKVVIPEPFVNTCIFARCVDIMVRIAGILSLDAAGHAALLAKTRSAIHAAYFDEASQRYCQGIQGADAFALEAGLGDAALAEQMASHYNAHPWFDTGFLGTGSVIRQLMTYGYADTAVALLSSNEPEHSFGWQRQQGATTLWECWNGRDSHNHPMFGGCIGGMLDGLMGISLESPLTIKPQPVRQLAWAEGEMDTKSGHVKVSWRWEGEQLRLTTTLPCPAVVQLPGRKLTLPAGQSSVLLDLTT